MERLFATPSTSACFPSNSLAFGDPYYGLADARVRARRLHLPAARRAPIPARQVPDGARGGRGASRTSTSTTPTPRGGDDLRRTHTADWVERVRDGRLERREQLGLGLPWSPELVERPPRDRGDDLAARAALEDGVAANLGGGTHHAFADVGRGFCVFNDVGPPCA